MSIGDCSPIGERGGLSIVLPEALVRRDKLVRFADKPSRYVYDKGSLYLPYIMSVTELMYLRVCGFARVPKYSQGILDPQSSKRLPSQNLR